MSESSSPNLEEPINEEITSEREALMKSLGQDFANYTYDGNFSVYFKLVHNREEAENDIRGDTFFPDYVHQFFVDAERIFGYKKPVLRLFYTASRLKRYVKFDYQDKLTRERDRIDADDVMAYLSPILDDIEYTQDLNNFIADASSKEEQEFKPPGDLLYEFETDYKKPLMLSRAQREKLEEAGDLNSNGMTNGNSSNVNGSSKAQNGDSKPAASSSSASTTMCNEDSPVCKKRFQIFHATDSTKGFKQFQARMQTLVMWFIESATMIDFEDPKWDCFMIFEKYNPSSDSRTTPVSTEDRYYFAGYATVYRYYAYPDKTRPRVAQMLLLPPYRRNGLGTTLLQSIYDFYKKQPATLDMTAEDPDEEFISMRDLLDCKNCQKLPMFQPDKLGQGWSEEMANEAQQQLKLCHRQSRKVYEILKLMNIDTSDENVYKKYRLEIKNRLNIPNQRLKLDINRAVKRDPKVYIPDEMKLPENPKMIAATLEDNYNLLEKQYQHIIDKLRQSRACS